MRRLRRTGVARPEEYFASTAAKRVTAKTAAGLRSAFTAATRVTVKNAVGRHSAFTAAARVDVKNAAGLRSALTTALRVSVKSAAGLRSAFTAAKGPIAKTAVGRRSAFTDIKRVTATSARRARMRWKKGEPEDFFWMRLAPTGGEGVHSAGKLGLGFRVWTIIKIGFVFFEHRCRC
jgi:hypothetical protein